MRRKMGLCVALAMMVIFAAAAGLAGCGDGSGGAESTTIESLPYSFPYYKDATIELVSVNLYQTEKEDHGKIEYSPYVIVEVDESGKNKLSEDDAYWATQEIRMSYSCDLDSKANDIPYDEQELNLITSGKATNGNYYYAFSAFDARKGQSKYYADFSESEIRIGIFVHEADSEEPEKESELIAYFYSEDFETAQSANDMDPKIQQAIVDAMGRAATAYINQLRGR